MPFWSPDLILKLEFLKHEQNGANEKLRIEALQYYKDLKSADLKFE